MGRPMNNDSAKKRWECRRHVRQKEPAPSAEVRRTTRPRMWQALRAKEDARVYAELQSKQRAAYGDDEAAREAAGKAALLRAKESLSTGWRARLCYTQRVRLAAVSSRLRGVHQRVQAVGSARECARERATRERKEKKANGLPFENY